MVRKAIVSGTLALPPRLIVGPIFRQIEAIGRPAVPSQTGPIVALKWQLPNGDTYSMTRPQITEIVYVDTDWGRQSDGQSSDFSSFSYGVTDLAEIAKKFGSDGFAFRNRNSMIKLGDGLIASSYEISGQDEVVVTFISKVGKDNVKCVQQPQDIGKCAVLERSHWAISVIWAASGASRFAMPRATVRSPCNELAPGFFSACCARDFMIASTMIAA